MSSSSTHNRTHLVSVPRVQYSESHESETLCRDETERWDKQRWSMYVFAPYCCSDRLAHSLRRVVDAKISFNQGLTVVWAGKPIGNMKLTDVDVVGDVGAVLDVETTFDVTDVDHITEFTKVDICIERTGRL